MIPSPDATPGDGLLAARATPPGPADLILKHALAPETMQSGFKVPLGMAEYFFRPGRDYGHSNRQSSHEWPGHFEVIENYLGTAAVAPAPTTAITAGTATTIKAPTAAIVTAAAVKISAVVMAAAAVAMMAVVSVMAGGA